MKIWGRDNSTNVRKALWAADELGLTYERVDAGGAFGVVRDAAYLTLNPNGLIPCLQDGDLVLWESNAIVRYLARRYGKAPFAPADAKGWANADQWMDWTSLSFGSPFRDVFWNLLRIAAENRDMNAVARGTDECIRLMGIADRALDRSPFLSGAHFGIADIPLGAIAYAWFALPIARPEHPNLQAWYGRISARPAFCSGVMTPLT